MLYMGDFFSLFADDYTVFLFTFYTPFFTIFCIPSVGYFNMLADTVTEVFPFIKLR